MQGQRRYQIVTREPTEFDKVKLRKSLRRNQLFVGLLTFWSYASLHIARQSFANAKHKMKSEWNFSKPFLGALDSVFLSAYAIGLFVSGMSADQWPADRVLCAGLISTSAVIGIFAVSVPFGVPTHYNFYFIMLWIVNGFCQSCCWPTSVKLMSNWFTADGEHGNGHAHAGLIFGLWSANASAGNILGSMCSTIVNRLGLSVSWMLIIPAINLAFVSIIVFAVVRESPEIKGLSLAPQLEDSESITPTGTSVSDSLSETERKPHGKSLQSGPTQVEVWVTSLNSAKSSDSSHQSSSGLLQQWTEDEEEKHVQSLESSLAVDSERDSASQGVADEPKSAIDCHSQAATDKSKAIEHSDSSQRISIWRALRIPGVIQFSLSYAALKAVNYTFFFWIPFLLERRGMHENAADQMEEIYNIAQVLGGWTVGFLSDGVFEGIRSVPVVISLLCGTVPVFMLRIPSASKVFVGGLCALAGFLIGGPANIVSSVVAAELGAHPSVGSEKALSTVTGIVDGTASFGAAAMMLVVALSPSFELVFILLAFLLVLSCALIAKVFVTDLRQWLRRRKETSRLHLW